MASKQITSKAELDVYHVCGEKKDTQNRRGLTIVGVMQSVMYDVVSSRSHSRSFNGVGKNDTEKKREMAQCVHACGTRCGSGRISRGYDVDKWREMERGNREGKVAHGTKDRSRNKVARGSGELAHMESRTQNTVNSTETQYRYGDDAKWP